MSNVVTEMASSLEEYGSSRANFHEVNPTSRHMVARYLVIARSQANASNAPEDMTEGRYGEELRRKRDAYFHACGRAGIDMKEASIIWSNVV